MAKTRIAFVGLGAMGQGMALRLIDSGHQLSVYNRTRSKSDEVAAAGARAAASPADAARDAEIVMLSLADQHVVESMLFGERGVFASLPTGAYICDTSTVPPDFAREMSARAVSTGHHALDTCILGNNRHARSGELRVMVGGDEADFRAVEDVLACIGKEVTYLGGSGMGTAMKLVLNMLMGIEMQALAEAVVFGERAGLPRDKVLQMIAKSGYSAPVMSFKCGAMGRRSWNQVDFKLSLMRKDMMLVLSEAQELGVPMPASESTYSLLTAAKQRGLGDLDCASILAYMEQISGLGTYPWPGTPLTSDGSST